MACLPQASSATQGRQFRALEDAIAALEARRRRQRPTTATAADLSGAAAGPSGAGAAAAGASGAGAEAAGPSGAGAAATGAAAPGARSVGGVTWPSVRSHVGPEPPANLADEVAAEGTDGGGGAGAGNGHAPAADLATPTMTWHLGQQAAVTSPVAESASIAGLVSREGSEGSPGCGAAAGGAAAGAAASSGITRIEGSGGSGGSGGSSVVQYGDGTSPQDRVASLEQIQRLLPLAHDDARLLIERDGGLSSPRGEAARVLLYLFERDYGVQLLRGG